MIRGETRSNPDSIRFCELGSAVMKLRGRTSDVTPPKPTPVLSCYVPVASLPQIKRHLQRYFRETKGLSPKSIFPSWSLCTAELHSRAARDPGPAQRGGLEQGLAQPMQAPGTLRRATAPLHRQNPSRHRAGVSQAPCSKPGPARTKQLPPEQRAVPARAQRAARHGTAWHGTARHQG